MTFLKILYVRKTVGLALLLAFASSVRAEKVTSPDGQLVASVSIDQQGRPTYEVLFQGKPVVVPSQLRLNFADGSSLGESSKIENHETREIKETFHQFPGKRSQVNSLSNELTVFFKERGSEPREWQVVVRVFDDGVALRYRIPKQAGGQDVRLASEATHFTFPSEAKATYLPLPGFVTSFENDYRTSSVAEVPEDQLYGIPLLVEVPGVGVAAVAEANLKNYAGMFLKKVKDQPALVTTLSPRPDQKDVAVVAKLPLETPWRVIFVSGQAYELIDSDLPLKLNAPSVIGDTSWIEPGKTTFPWWNGFYEEGIPFESNLNTDFAKYYIDFCAEYGIPYHSLDGENHLAWYGGPIGYQGDDPTTATDGLDLQEVLAYAKQKGVRIRVWMHWMAARDHMRRAFPLYHQWGIEGVMIDFMDRNDQQMVEFQHELLQLAAENHLTVNFHGVAAPTGLERTYPNLLNSEAVRSLEYDKWDAKGVSPQHDVTVPFTRMLAGPMDYHQGSLRTVPVEEFRPFDAAPSVIGTPCHMLATYVVYQNHLPMMGDYPSAYRRHPLTKIMAKVPVSWDETRALAGEVGQYVVVARRAGEEWWIGAMTNHEPRQVTIPLNFLDPAQYQATVYKDSPAAEHHYRETIRKGVSHGDKIEISLGESGGALIRLVP
jgi:alpha-glucosidase